jgi:arylsulfatase A-like enzyme
MIKHHILIAILLISPILLYSQEQVAGRPNVLLIISDDLNTRIGPYTDIDNYTPNLDRLAAEGIRFSRTYCQYPICGPSRASLMSGLYCETNGVLRNNDQPGSYRKSTPALSKHPSLAGFFREQGYYTARVSKIYHMGVPGGIERGDPGGDDPDSWDYAYNVMGPETLSDGSLELLSPGNLHYGSNFARMILPNELRGTQADYLAVSQAIAILENRAGPLPPGGRNKQKLKADAPLFLGVGLVRPHVPLIAPEDCFEPFDEEEMVVPEPITGANVPPPALARRNNNIWQMDESQKKKVISAYMASVKFMDEQVGRLLDALDRLEMRDNTIVVFISDHGYNLGEHDCWSKISLWEGSVRIPMIISHPKAKDQHGSTYDGITELIDLYPTLAGLCKMDSLQPGILQGESLSELIVTGSRPASDRIAYTITNGGHAASIRSTRWRYNRWGEEALTGMEELYDHQNDPEEHHNLAGQAAYQETLKEMRETFEKTRFRARNGLSMLQVRQ